jgi:hypothetical protein
MVGRQSRIYRVGSGLLVLGLLMLLAGSGIHHHDLTPSCCTDLQTHVSQDGSPSPDNCPVCIASQTWGASGSPATVAPPLVETHAYLLKSDPDPCVLHRSSCNPRAPPRIPSHEA